MISAGAKLQEKVNQLGKTERRYNRNLLLRKIVRAWQEATTFLKAAQKHHNLILETKPRIDIRKVRR